MRLPISLSSTSVSCSTKISLSNERFESKSPRPSGPLHVTMKRVQAKWDERRRHEYDLHGSQEPEERNPSEYVAYFQLHFRS